MRSHCISMLKLSREVCTPAYRFIALLCASICDNLLLQLCTLVVCVH